MDPLGKVHGLTAPARALLSGSLKPAPSGSCSRPFSTYSPGFSRDATVARAELSCLPPLLRSILVADGTITMLLEAYLWEPVHVRVLSQTIDQQDLFGLGSDEVLHREAVLVSGRGNALCLARSVVALNALELDLREALLHMTTGVGALLRERGLETFREHLAVAARSADADGAILNTASDAVIIERTYRIHMKGRPFAQIRESFPISTYDAYLQAS
jgi:chorismate-pyruvate lyase